MRRQHRDIIACVLELCQTKPQLKTHTMFQCNLSFKQISDLIIELKNYDLISEFQKRHYGAQRRCFLTTPKGKEWLINFMLTKNLEGGEKKHE